MPFIPHTKDDVQSMLSSIGVESIDQLFSEIPESICCGELEKIPAGMNELAMTQHMDALAAENKPAQCYLGAGAYEHYIPAAVWSVATRGEFLTAYTPYQAEVSQGLLQVIYEYQTMISGLMGMEVSNASQYDGATATAEAILMALRLNAKKTKSNRILLAGTLPPTYIETIQTIVGKQDVALEIVPFQAQDGRLPDAMFVDKDAEGFCAVVVAQPNFLGVCEEVDALVDWAHEQKALVVAVVNPIAMALLKEPGAWGKKGADIACGEGQPLGIPLASGGPYFGFMCTRKSFIRQMPGRIVGRTVDLDGQQGFTLTLQAREQHIRRAKATSNICTNQGLMVTAATVFMSLMGFEGLAQVARSCHQKSAALRAALANIDGVTLVHDQPFFHEFVIKTNKPAQKVLEAMQERGIQAGYELGQHYPDYEDSFSICVTETKTNHDLKAYQVALESVLKSL